MRGLILGDTVPPIFPSAMIAEKAVQAMMGIWGTPKGRDMLARISLTKADSVGGCT
jgi:hypothetical protein